MFYLQTHDLSASEACVFFKKKMMRELSLSLSNVSWDFNAFIHIWIQSEYGTENEAKVLSLVDRVHGKMCLQVGHRIFVALYEVYCMDVMSMHFTVYLFIYLQPG